MRTSTVIKKLNKAYPKATKLLQNRWLKENKESIEKSTGFCYNAAEAAFYALGGYKFGWTPYVASYFDRGIKCTHWWIQRNGTKCDPTINQYLAYGKQPPYHLGRRTGFLTNIPSKRTKELMKIAGLGVKNAPCSET